MNRFFGCAAALAVAMGVAACGGGGDGTSGGGGGGGSGGGGGGGNQLAQRQVAVRVDSPMAAGETFQFALGPTLAITITQSGQTVAFTTLLAEGSAYAVTQAGGPRSCALSGNGSGTVGGANVLVTAQCGVAASGSVLSGEWRAPVGTALSLRVNGGGDLPLVMGPGSGSNRYHAAPFSFATPLADGSAYAVTLAAAPADQACSVYRGATGTVPAAAGTLKVGCEFVFDLASRSSGDNGFGGYADTLQAQVGGLPNPATGGAEGRYIVFVSTSSAVAGPTGGSTQVFWRDRLTGLTRMVSTNAAGQAGNNSSREPALSADGLTVVFESVATDLVSGDTNGASDVFLWSALNPCAGVQRVSVAPSGAQANAGSRQAAVSGDGRFVAFGSNASNLADGVLGTGATNVFLRDNTTGAVTLISRGSVGPGNGIGVGGQYPALSADGSRIAFWSNSRELTAGDNNGLWDVFVYQAGAAPLRRVTLTAAGTERNAGTESGNRVVAPAISGNGRFVAYATTASNIVAGDTNGLQDVFVVDLDAAGPGVAVQRVSVAGTVEGDGASPKDAGERASLSHDGTWVAFTTGAGNLGVPANNVLLVNRTTGEVRAGSAVAGGAVGTPALSHSGAYVVFAARDNLDARFASNGGVFARFTGLARAWWWID
jgi:Tol biopolymer transport system component